MAASALIRHHKGAWVVAGLAVVVPLLFALHTNHIWEDYLITLRSSRNLVEGQGLVYQAGEHVHTFTSPLGVLLPAAFMALAGSDADGVVLWFFRLTSIAALAGAMLLLWRITVEDQWSRLARFVLFGLLLTESKLSDFAINGQESAFVVLFVALIVCGLRWLPTRGPGPLAAGYAGLMWTRPDGFVLAGAITLAHFIFQRNDPGQPPLDWRRWSRATLISIALYLPWLVAAWIYYGTPVPHTIWAKAASGVPAPILSALTAPWHLLTDRTAMEWIFLPSYFAFGGWPDGLANIARLLAVLAGFSWLWRQLTPTARSASFALMLGSCYLLAIMPYPWYFQGWLVLAALALGGLTDALWKRWTGRRRARVALGAAGALVILVQAAVWLAVARQTRVQQAVIEEQVRRPIGEWLRTQVAPGESVFLEPLGYIGYHSRAKMLDAIGLCAPEVVALRRQNRASMAGLIDGLKPDWVVVRYTEMVGEELESRGALAGYRFRRRWDARDLIAAEPWVGGRPWLMHDAAFMVFQRVPPRPEKASQPIADR